MSNLGESRTELLSWLNDLLRLNYTKVEQCGTGAAYCQIMDSIYGDLPMHRVKFDARAEYESLTNFKILQSCFTKHRIEKTVFVDRLIKCRFQDNLEFLQWLKKFWNQNKDESTYDAESRRKSARPVSMRSSPQSSTTTNKRTMTASYSSAVGAGTPANTQPRVLQKTRTTVQGASSNGGAFAASTRMPSGGSTSRPQVQSKNQSAANNEQVAMLQSELNTAETKIEKMTHEMIQYQDAMNIMERERDFYFGKLRDIEILVQSTQDLYKEGVYNDDPHELNRFLGKVNQILYSTEEGFEVTSGIDAGASADNTGIGMERAIESTTPLHNLITDEETF